MSWRRYKKKTKDSDNERKRELERDSQVGKLIDNERDRVWIQEISDKGWLKWERES